MMDENDRYQEYFDYFSDQLSIDLLKKDYPYDSEMLDNILELIVETVCTKRPLIRIGAEERPAEIVRSRFMKLNVEHIRYSMEELGQRLGLKEATAYELVAKGHFDVVDVLGKRRVTKESFERWYASQTDYRTVEDQELDADIMASTYGLPEMARMLGVHRQTIYYIVANEDFELIKVGRYKRATKESFEKWYQNQTRYQLAEDRQERS